MQCLACPAHSLDQDIDVVRMNQLLPVKDRARTGRNMLECYSRATTHRGHGEPDSAPPLDQVGMLLNNVCGCLTDRANTNDGQKDFLHTVCEARAARIYF